MQAVNSNILIKKIDEYLKDNPALLENEIISLMLKKEVICNEFNLSLDNLSECSVTQKFYSRFFIVEVRDLNNNLIGIRLNTDDDEKYQVSSITKKTDEVVTIKEEYIVDDLELKLLVGVQRNTNGQEGIFTMMPNTSLASCSDLREKAETKILQVVEELLGKDEMKIYQIHRKEPVIPKFSHNLDNIISYEDRKRSYNI